MARTFIHAADAFGRAALVATLLVGGVAFAANAETSPRVALPARAATERGFPLITVFSPRVHQAGAQVFDVNQDARGLLYFATLGGVAVYDGAWWKLIELPNDSAALALQRDRSGRIAVGGLGEIGFITTTAEGSHAYRSLVGALPEAQRDVGEVGSVCNVTGGSLFVSRNGLYFSDGTSIGRLTDFSSLETAPRRCFNVNGRVLLTGAAGVQEFDQRTRLLGSPLPSFAGHKASVVLPLRDAAVVVVEDVGLFSLGGSTAIPFAPKTAAWLRGKHVTSGCVLADGRLVLTTRVDGLIVIAPDGTVDEIIDAAAGLPEDVLEGAFVDQEHALWLAFDGPIARLDLTSPVSLLDSRRGIKGAASSVAHWQNRLYVGTSHGLYVVDGASENSSATRLPDVPNSAWDLLPLDAEMLIGTERGVRQLDRSGRISTIPATEEFSFYALRRSPSDPSRVWLATQKGLASMIHRPNGWAFERIVPGTPEYVSSVLEKNGVVWCGTLFNGIQRVDGATGATPRFRTYGSGETNVFEIDGRVIFVRTKGEIVSLDVQGALVSDPQLGHIRTTRPFFLVAQDRAGDVWVNSRPPQLFARTRGGYAREGEPLVQVDASDIQLMRADEQGVVWFGTDRGLFRYEAASAQPASAPPTPLVHRVVAGRNLLYGSGAKESSPTPRLRFGFGRLRVEFAPLSYRPGLMYQYRLDPADAEWSRWSEEPFVDYTNLQEGSYTLHVRTRGAAGKPSAIADWSFDVTPPWYRAPWMILLWSLLAIALIIVLIRVRTTAFRRDAEHLRVSIAERTEELRRTVEQLESAQQELVTKNNLLEHLSLVDDLTGIANRRFFQQALTTEWKRALRRQTPISLILLDLDHFKQLNDTQGHLAGDACLREIGRFLRESVRRAGDVVSRYGGEEFTILLPGSDADVARRLAELLRMGIGGLTMPAEAGNGRMTASCGVATMVPASVDVMETLVDRADRALYYAKQSGRNCVRVADEALDATLA